MDEHASYGNAQAHAHAHAHAGNGSSNANNDDIDNNHVRTDSMIVLASPQVRGEDGNLISLNDRVHASARMFVDYTTTANEVMDGHEMTAAATTCTTESGTSNSFPSLRLVTEITVRLVVYPLVIPQQQHQQHNQHHIVIEEEVQGGRGGRPPVTTVGIEVFKFDSVKMRKESEAMQDTVRALLKESYSKCALVFCVWLVGEYDRLSVADADSLSESINNHGGQRHDGSDGRQHQQQDEEGQHIHAAHHSPILHGHMLWGSLLGQIDASPKTRKLLPSYIGERGYSREILDAIVDIAVKARSAEADWGAWKDVWTKAWLSCGAVELPDRRKVLHYLRRQIYGRINVSKHKVINTIVAKVCTPAGYTGSWKFSPAVLRKPWSDEVMQLVFGGTGTGGGGASGGGVGGNEEFNLGQTHQHQLQHQHQHQLQHQHEAHQHEVQQLHNVQQQQVHNMQQQHHQMQMQMQQQLESGNNDGTVAAIAAANEQMLIVQQQQASDLQHHHQGELQQLQQVHVRQIQQLQQQQQQDMQNYEQQQQQQQEEEEQQQHRDHTQQHEHEQQTHDGGEMDVESSQQQQEHEQQHEPGLVSLNNNSSVMPAVVTNSLTDMVHGGKDTAYSRICAATGMHKDMESAIVFMAAKILKDKLEMGESPVAGIMRVGGGLSSHDVHSGSDQTAGAGDDSMNGDQQQHQQHQQLGDQQQQQQQQHHYQPVGMNGDVSGGGSSSASVSTSAGDARSGVGGAASRNLQQQLQDQLQQQHANSSSGGSNSMGNGSGSGHHDGNNNSNGNGNMNSNSGNGIGVHYETGGNSDNNNNNNSAAAAVAAAGVVLDPGVLDQFHPMLRMFLWGVAMTRKDEDKLRRDPKEDTLRFEKDAEHMLAKKARLASAALALESARHKWKDGRQELLDDNGQPQA